MVTREILRHPLAWFNLPRDDDDFNRPRAVLSEYLGSRPPAWYNVAQGW